MWNHSAEVNRFVNLNSWNSDLNHTNSDIGVQIQCNYCAKQMRHTQRIPNLLKCHQLWISRAKRRNVWRCIWLHSYWVGKANYATNVWRTNEPHIWTAIPMTSFWLAPPPFALTITTILCPSPCDDAVCIVLTPAVTMSVWSTAKTAIGPTPINSSGTVCQQPSMGLCLTVSIWSCYYNILNATCK